MVKSKRQRYKEQESVIVQHKHCPVCAKPISMKKRYCSSQCEEQDKKLSRRRTYTLIATMAIFPILIIITMLLQ